MGFLQDYGQFLRSLLSLLGLYVLYAHLTDYDADALAIGLVVLGVATFTLVAYRYRDDFALESDE
jgi:hypothetical protein